MSTIEQGSGPKNTCLTMEEFHDQFAIVGLKESLESNYDLATVVVGWLVEQEIISEYVADEAHKRANS